MTENASCFATPRLQCARRRRHQSSSSCHAFYHWKLYFISQNFYKHIRYYYLCCTWSSDVVSGYVSFLWRMVTAHSLYFTHFTIIKSSIVVDGETAGASLASCISSSCPSIIQPLNQQWKGGLPTHEALLKQHKSNSEEGSKLIIFY